MNFAEKLTYKAETHELISDVQREMESVKKRMEEYYYKREYTIELIKPKSNMAFGGNCTNFSHLFVPYGVSPAHYRQLFMDELLKLGFKGTDIELDEFDCRSYTSYKIIVRW